MKYNEVCLADVCDLIAGYAFKSKDFGDFDDKVIKITHITPPIVDMNGLSGVDFSKYNREKLKRYIAQSGDYVLAMTGATIGKIGRIVSGEAYINQRVLLFKNKDAIDKDFLYYVLLQHDFEQYVYNHIDSESAQPNISATTIGKYIFSLPPMSIQQKIGRLLRSLDEKCEVNNAINHNLQQQAAALFKEWFIDNPDSSSWREGTFSNLIERTISGDWGKDSPTNNNTEMVYCIRGADIPEVRAGNKGKMPIRYIPPKNFATKRLVDGDIVVEISGGSPTQSTGRAAVVSDSLLARYDKGMVCTNFCKALKPIAGFSMYVFYYWQYLYNLGVFFSYENGTTGIKNLDINGFLETESINIAPVKLIEKFNTFCQSVNARVYANGLENERLAEIRDMILPKLMSGEIDVSEVEL